MGIVTTRNGTFIHRAQCSRCEPKVELLVGVATR